VSVYAAPRDGATARGKDAGRPDSLRVLTGSDAQLRSNIDEGSVAAGCITFATRSANPYAGGGSYPAGTTGAGTDTLTLPGGTDQRVWVELYISNWACSGTQMGTWQAQYGPDGVLPAGIGRPVQPCAATADCVNAGFGPGDGAGCGLGVPGQCDPNFEQDPPQQPTALGFDIEACNSPNLACGGTQVAAPPVADDGTAHYAMTLVVEVDAAFVGSAQINVQGLGADTFYQDQNGAQVPIGKATPLTITVAEGSCCNLDGSCTPDTTQGACGNGPPFFRPGAACPDDGGPACIECTVNADCSDAAGACTTSTCVSNFCVHTPIACALDPANCCNPANGACAPVADTDPCTTDTCSAGGNLGTPTHNPSPDGTGCDDDNPCTAGDDCTGGLCSGDNVNGLVCVVDADCQFDGDTPGAVCVDGLCDCALAPDLNFVIDDEDNCFSVGEKINVAIRVGPAASPINGGQFAISYDPTCLDFVSISPVPPYINEIMEQVDEGAGTIFYAVGIALGAPDGPPGGADMATISFLRRAGCEQCELCFTNVNPRHTYLTDDEGQAVKVESKCSDVIAQLPVVTIDGPETVKLKVGCNSAVACHTWDAPSADSDCDGVELTCSGEHLESGCTAGNCCGGTRAGLPCTSNAPGQCPLGNCFPSATSGGCFPVGNTNFCCTATSEKCGVTAEHCWTVTVNDATALDVEIQLSPTMVTKPGGGIIRCIEFEVFSNCVQAPLTFCEDVVFGGLFQLIGHFNGGIKIPSQTQPECITARDKLHTLRSCYLFDGDEDCDENGVLHATFKGDPFFGGNWLIGGNLDGWKKDNPQASHDVIDILDFGQIVAEWLTDYGTGDTPCPEDCHPDEANADINGDGVADILDYSFVAMNFLEDSKDCCCPGSASSLGNRVGRTEISVSELNRSNLKDLTVADLNNDGLVNLQDMAALMQGVRPTRQAPDRDNGKGTNGSR